MTQPIFKVYSRDGEEYVPARKTAKSAAYDIFLTEDLEMSPGSSRMINTGIVIDPCEHDEPIAYFLMPRSSSAKRGIYFLNTIGLIDGDYNGPKDELKIALASRPLEAHEYDEDTTSRLRFLKPELMKYMKKRDSTFKKGERIAQIVFFNPLLPTLEYSGAVKEDGESRGGFGSTGK